MKTIRLSEQPLMQLDGKYPKEVRGAFVFWGREEALPLGRDDSSQSAYYYVDGDGLWYIPLAMFVMLERAQDEHLNKLAEHIDGGYRALKRAELAGAQRDEFKKALADELEGKAALGREFGQAQNETFEGFVRRLAEGQNKREAGMIERMRQLNSERERLLRIVERLASSVERTAGGPR